MTLSHVVPLSWPSGSEFLTLKIIRKPSGFPLSSSHEIISFFSVQQCSISPVLLTSTSGSPAFSIPCYSRQPRHICFAHVPKPIVFAVSSVLVVETVFSLLNTSLAFATEGFAVQCASPGTEKVARAAWHVLPHAG